MHYKVINVKGEGRIGLKPVAFHTAQAQSQNSNQLNHERFMYTFSFTFATLVRQFLYPKCMAFSEVKMLYSFM